LVRASAATLAIVAMSRLASAQDAVGFAQQRFLRGQQLFNARDYAAALDEFRASLELYASPNSRLYVARALRETGRLGEAYVQFDQAEREASERAASDPRYGPTRDAAHDELRDLAPRIGRVRVDVPDATSATELRVEGRAVPHAAIGLLVPITPGAVHVEVVEADRVMAERTVIVAAGQERTLTISRVAHAPAVSAAPPARPAAVSGPSGSVAPVTALRVAGWTAVALGSGALAGSAVVGAFESADFSSVMHACGGPCTNGADIATLEQGMSLQVATNVLLSAGIGLAALATVLLLVDAATPPSHRPARAAMNAPVRLW
jgi:hypothetical protein